ncbi:hypothetical protein [Adonisia turfae]|uniref:hypothetical protein n=1 Tax=Adonisia turfae TaxID=2950184 RepID=UPI0013D6FB07|nr:hypothetical protein [Adonisia turfae]
MWKWCEIVTDLDNLQTKINTLRTLQPQTAIELDALLPPSSTKPSKAMSKDLSTHHPNPITPPLSKLRLY